MPCCLNLNYILYVSVRYEKINNLWWILLLSIGLPAIVIAVILTFILLKLKNKNETIKELYEETEKQ